MKKLTLLLLCIIINLQSFADEGLWLPMYLRMYNEADMKALGLKLRSEEIYSETIPSLKDAVVLFGGGCTGFMISDKGLLMTNHHCGYSNIQRLSTVESNFLLNGYWAGDMKEELPCPGLTVSFLIHLEDVTDSIVYGTSPTMSEKLRNETIEQAMQELIQNLGDRYPNTEAEILPAFNNTRYFLQITRTYRDIRFVGAPAESIGNFGGDTDNWMWPRHNADFSMFRIYADSANNPASYSKNNIPLTPLKYFKLSSTPVKENDFAMILGFPGTTEEYLPQKAVELPVKHEIPISVKISNTKLNTLNGFMQEGEKQRLNYTSRYASIANVNKKYKGILYGFKRFNTLQQKKTHDSLAQNWINSTQKRKEKYGTLFNSYDSIYKQLRFATEWNTYFFEALWRNETVQHIAKYRELLLIPSESKKEIDEKKLSLISYQTSFFKRFKVDHHRILFAAMIKQMYADIPPSLQPIEFLYSLMKYKNNTDDYCQALFEKSMLLNPKKLDKFTQNYKPSHKKKLLKDPLFQLINEYVKTYAANFKEAAQSLAMDSLNRQYMYMLREMYPDSLFYPDANHTMRLSFGTIKGYAARDAISYRWQTSTHGIIEKADSTNPEFNAPADFLTTLARGDFKPYSSDSMMPVCFLTTCQTSGGNSGSPMINAYGEIIGINFDRNWEGTMSDYDYNPEICRNIATDITYIKFLIDRIGNAEYIVKELNLHKSN